jgi:ankyrin repeat protein
MNDRRFDHFRSLALEEDLAGLTRMLDAGFGVDTLNAAHQTVLMHCCANDRRGAAKFLVSRGADLNLSDHGGTTALDFARRHASRDLCDWLARAGAVTGTAADFGHRPADQPGT